MVSAPLFVFALFFVAAFQQIAPVDASGGASSWVPNGDCNGCRLRNLFANTLLDPTVLREECGSLVYEVSGAVDIAHLGIFAEPSADNGPYDRKKCPPMFLHTPNPSNKIIEARGIKSFESGALYPLGNYELNKILDVYEPIPTSEATYDVVTNHCALLVFRMMCGLNIPITQAMEEWTSNRLMRSKVTREKVKHLFEDSEKAHHLDVVGIDWEVDNKGQAIRKLVSYDISNFQCIEPEV